MITIGTTTCIDSTGRYQRIGVSDLGSPHFGYVKKAVAPHFLCIKDAVALVGTAPFVKRKCGGMTLCMNKKSGGTALCLCKKCGGTTLCVNKKCGAPWGTTIPDRDKVCWPPKEEKIICPISPRCCVPTPIVISVFVSMLSTMWKGLPHKWLRPYTLIPC